MDDEDRILERALELTDERIEVPDGFAEGVLARLDARASRRRRLWPWALAAAAMVGVLGAERMVPREGVLENPPTASSVVEIELGGAVATLWPGTEGRFESQGFLAPRLQRVALERGAAFLRVDGPMDIDVPGARLVVSRDACLEVELGAGGRMSSRWASAGFFGGGVLAGAMTLVLYEGAVRVEHASGQTDLEAGQGLRIDGEGHVSRGSLAARIADPEAPDMTSSLAGPSEFVAAGGVNVVAATEAARLAAEVTRLRSLLSQHSISPETGERDSNARRGIDVDGNTDLTPDEWRSLAERGELRWRIPGRGLQLTNDRMVEALGLAPDDVDAIDRTQQQHLSALTERVRELYREATGGDGAGMSLDGMVSEISDKSDGRGVGRALDAGSGARRVGRTRAARFGLFDVRAHDARADLARVQSGAGPCRPVRSRARPRDSLR
jgi:hypothetical protein